VSGAGNPGRSRPSGRQDRLESVSAAGKAGPLARVRRVVLHPLLRAVPVADSKPGEQAFEMFERYSGAGGRNTGDVRRGEDRQAEMPICVTILPWRSAITAAWRQWPTTAWAPSNWELSPKSLDCRVRSCRSDGTTSPCSRFAARRYAAPAAFG